MLVSLDEAARTAEKLRAEGKTVVLCHGTFDLLHPGHIKHLEAARREGDVLVVGITADRYVNKGPGRPVFNEVLRAESVALLSCVDYTFVSEHPTAVEVIQKLRPHVYVKGGEYRDRPPDRTQHLPEEIRTLETCGGRMCYTDEIAFSSSELLNKHFPVYPEGTRAFLQDFRSRHTAVEIIEQLKKLRSLRVMVIGDAIIDQYVYCEGLGKSMKDNIITTRYLSEESFAGGALAVANQVAAFCDRVHLVTRVGGQNDHVDFIVSHLKPNIQVKFFREAGACTPVKTRFVESSFLGKLFEVAHLDSRPSTLQREICSYLETNIQDYDLVLVVDFGHGFIDEAVASFICEAAPRLALNAQTNSANYGFNLVTRYHSGDYLCLDELELRLACQDRFGDVTELARRMSYECVSVTRGHRGSLVSCNGQMVEVPALTDRAVDRMGTGDAYLSVTAPLALHGCPPEIIGLVGNAVGGLKAQIIGNREVVEAGDLFKFIRTLLK